MKGGGTEPFETLPTMADTTVTSKRWQFLPQDMRID